MTQDDESFSDTTHTRIARTFRQVRGNVSTQRVSDRTRDLGMLTTRDTITNFENRRKRSIDVADLIVLAEAIDVAPLSLIYPDVLTGPVEYLPGVVLPTDQAIARFCGHPDYEPRNATSLALYWDYMSASGDAKEQAKEFGKRYHKWEI